MNTWDDYIIAQQNYQHLEKSDAHLFHLLGLLIEPEFGTEVAAVMLGSSLRSARLMLERLVEAHLLMPVSDGRYRLPDRIRRLAQKRLDDQPAEIQTAARLQAIHWYSSSLRRVDAAGAAAMDITREFPALLDGNSSTS